PGADRTERVERCKRTCARQPNGARTEAVLRWAVSDDSRYAVRFRRKKRTREENAMSARTTPPFRADHVGSFLRPGYLLDARAQAAAGEITPLQLRAVEDKAIAEIVKFQEDVGLTSITD